MRRNERFYRGDQWRECTADLPRPVFNLVRRVTDYLVSSVLSETLSIRYFDDGMPFIGQEAVRGAINEGLKVLEENALWRWRREGMHALSYRALLDAAISGDGVFYCRWDPQRRDGQLFDGDISTELIDSADLYVADVTLDDLQKQRYILLAGQAPVEELRREAREAGLDEGTVARIVSDTDGETRPGDRGREVMEEGERATYLLRFWREDGEVWMETSTKDCVIRRVATGLSRYPVAQFHWHECKNSYLGSSPVSDMVANQKYINTAYAMAMKHMSDTAFSKIVYDKSRIPEWSNEIGEAIAAMGGGNVADAISVVGVGELQEGYLELIENVIENTKAMMGATESALGDAAAHNTSAILTLQTASRLTLHHVRANFYRCIGKLAEIWADMLCTYCPPQRLLAVCREDGTSGAKRANYALLKTQLLRATAEVGNADRYTPTSTVTVLDKLLEMGALTVKDYLELLPDGVLADREAVKEKIRTKGDMTNE